MVDYPTWTATVHEEYQSRGGDYGAPGQAQGDVDVVQAITEAAAEWWKANKDEIKRLAVDGARRLASKLIDQYISQRGEFP